MNKCLNSYGLHTQCTKFTPDVDYPAYLYALEPNLPELLPSGWINTESTNSTKVTTIHLRGCHLTYAKTDAAYIVPHAGALSRGVALDAFFASMPGAMGVVSVDVLEEAVLVPVPVRGGWHVETPVRVETVESGFQCTRCAHATTCPVLDPVNLKNTSLDMPLADLIKRYGAMKACDEKMKEIRLVILGSMQMEDAEFCKINRVNISTTHLLDIVDQDGLLRAIQAEYPNVDLRLAVKLTRDALESLLGIKKCDINAVLLTKYKQYTRSSERKELRVR